MANAPHSPTHRPSREEKVRWILQQTFHRSLDEELGDIKENLQKGLSLEAAVEACLAEDGILASEQEQHATMLKEAHALYAELSALRDKDLDSRYKEAVLQQPASTKADFERWCEKAFWTVEEATALCLGNDPSGSTLRR